LGKYDIIFIENKERKLFMDALKALNIISGFLDGYLDETGNSIQEKVEEAEAFLYKYVKEKEDM
jgi:hypothetical protein